MERDPRYNTVKILIEGGHITEFKQIFDNIPRTNVSNDMGTNYRRFVKLIKNVTMLRVEDIATLAGFLDVDIRDVFNLVANQIDNDKKSRKKK